ncbi:MAG TPA: hypothetical protein PKK10_15370 [Woeseiaceae bacterium]|nr:hypothetical protein [Woeseiaceae bacterium]
MQTYPQAIFLAVGLIFLATQAQAGEKEGRHYKFVDEDGVTHYVDSVPAEYTDFDKDVVNNHGVTIGQIEGRKTIEEIEAEKLAEELRIQKELQLRADQALLATYQSVDEIEMHRDRRVELFQAQSRVTELYLRNLERQLEKLEREAAMYAPYSSDENAEMIDPDLVVAIQETKDTIERHNRNLKKYRDDEDAIVRQFAGDITRFKTLKGLN